VHNFFAIVGDNFLLLGGEVMENYEINNKTLALYGMGDKTRVYEEDLSFIVDKPASEIMEDSCEYFGSSLEGRKRGTEKLIGVHYKAPIIVEESNNIIFFPTSSPRLGTCSWLRFSCIDQYYYQNHNLIVEFKNGAKIVLDTTYGVVDNQILRSARLETVLNGRKNEKKL
jgi:competence protein ComK